MRDSLGIVVPNESLCSVVEPKFSAMTIALGNPSGCFTIKATGTGFDIEVPHGVTMSECAEAFVAALKDYLRELKL